MCVCVCVCVRLCLMKANGSQSESKSTHVETILEKRVLKLTHYDKRAPLFNSHLIYPLALFGEMIRPNHDHLLVARTLGCVRLARTRVDPRLANPTRRYVFVCFVSRARKPKENKQSRKDTNEEQTKRSATRVARVNRTLELGFAKTLYILKHIRFSIRLQTYTNLENNMHCLRGSETILDFFQFRICDVLPACPSLSLLILLFALGEGFAVWHGLLPECGPSNRLNYYQPNSNLERTAINRTAI